MSRGILAVAVLASVAIAASACTSSAPTGAAPTTGVVPSPSEAATVSTSPLSSTVDGGVPLSGTYTTTIPEGVNASPGEWTLTVDTGGVTFTRPDGQSFSPRAVKELTANEIVLAADPGCPTQEGTPTDGRYRWSVEGTSRTFELVSDSCQDRIDTLTTSAWSLSR